MLLIKKERGFYTHIHGLASMSSNELVVCRKGLPDVSEVTYSDISSSKHVL